MSALGPKQTGVPGLSARATAGHLGRAGHPASPLLSSRAALGHLGVGRRYTDTTSILHTRWHLPPPPPLPDFDRLRANALWLQHRLAAHDRAAAAAPAPPHPVAFHAPMMTPAQQQERQRRRAAYAQQLLAEYNRLQAAPYVYEPLRKYLAAGQLSLLNELGVAPASKPGPAGPDLFMPKSFWRSQNPTGSKEVGWALCCATVKKMMENHYGKGQVPNKRFDLVQEVNGPKWEHGLRVHDHYAAVSGPGPGQALAQLDNYMAAHKPVMVGVSHTLNLLFYNKKKGEYYRINDGTIDHFVAIVGTGVDAKGKYYRFFDVGTVDANREKGTSPLNRLYRNPTSGFYEGNTQVGHKPKYTLTQIRFFETYN